MIVDRYRFRSHLFLERFLKSVPHWLQIHRDYLSVDERTPFSLFSPLLLFLLSPLPHSSNRFAVKLAMYYPRFFFFSLSLRSSLFRVHLFNEVFFLASVVPFFLSCLCPRLGQKENVISPACVISTILWALASIPFPFSIIPLLPFVSGRLPSFFFPPASLRGRLLYSRSLSMAKFTKSPASTASRTTFFVVSPYRWNF